MILGTIFIERWRAIEPYLGFLQLQPHKDIELVWILDSCSDKFKNRLKDWRKKNKDYKRLTLIEVKNNPLEHWQIYQKGLSTPEKRARLAANMRILYNIARERKDDLCIIEDDIEPPIDAISRLKDMMRDKDCWVSGLPTTIDYENLWGGTLNLWRIEQIKGDCWECQRFANQDDYMGKIIPVGASGTTCELISKEFIKTGYLPYANFPILGPCGQDIFLGFTLKTKFPNKKWLLDTRTIARHYMEKYKGRAVII